MKTLAPVRPSPLIEAGYRVRLNRLIQQMQRSYAKWIPAAYRKHEPEVAALMAADDSPARNLARILARLGRYWQRRFDDASEDLARYFAQSTADRTTAALQSILRRGGFSVRFKTSRAVNDALQATVQENVSLIRSIGAQYHTEVEGLVMRSVQAGRDLSTLSGELEARYGITRRRAALISRDQNNKATATITRVRQAESGITEAIWVHSGGGKVPRPSHVKAGRDKQRFDVKTGWLDPAINKLIWPGTEVNCRCVSRPVVPGFS